MWYWGFIQVVNLVIILGRSEQLDEASLSFMGTTKFGQVNLFSHFVNPNTTFMFDVFYSFRSWWVPLMPFKGSIPTNQYSTSEYQTYVVKWNSIAHFKIANHFINNFFNHQMF
jgi:hypothetical protein